MVGGISWAGVFSSWSTVSAQDSGGGACLYIGVHDLSHLATSQMKMLWDLEPHIV